MSAVKLISLAYDNSRYEADMVTDAVTGLLDNASGFETAVIISLFTWQRVTDADQALAGQRFGWWGDTFSDDSEDQIGSQLWTLRRAPNSFETQRRLAKIAKDALAWMIVDGIAAAIDVETERHSLNAIAAKISITRADGGRWTGVWAIHLDRL